ncbi:hypothetical protein Dimus_018927 [Dionaea muscipula]
MRLFCITKRQANIPQEFDLAFNGKTLQMPVNVANLFDKLSLHSCGDHDHQIRRSTKPNPFHLQTEKRGAVKESKLLMEVMQKQLEEKRARIPKANPYPYTTDYRVV